MHNVINIKTGKPVEICCYQCGSGADILVKEFIHSVTHEILRKEFICAKCAGWEKGNIEGDFFLYPENEENK